MLSIYLNTDWLYYLVLIVCVGILQQLVFLFSCSVHKISTDDGSEFKVFSFYSEQRKGALTNFNLNVSRRSTTTPRFPPSSRDEGLRLLHGLETNLATSLQTPQEA